MQFFLPLSYRIHTIFRIYGRIISYLFSGLLSYSARIYCFLSCILLPSIFEWDKKDAEEREATERGKKLNNTIKHEIEHIWSWSKKKLYRSIGNTFGRYFHHSSEKLVLFFFSYSINARKHAPTERKWCPWQKEKYFLIYMKLCSFNISIKRKAGSLHIQYSAVLLILISNKNIILGDFLMVWFDQYSLNSQI